MDDSGNITQARQENVDEKICTTTTLEEDSKRGKEDGEDDFANVRCGECHFCGECGGGG